MSSKKCTADVPHDRGMVSQEEVQPWHRLGGVEHICELRKNASVLYSILVTILRGVYSDRRGRSFGCPDVLWNKDAQKTQIWIDTELRWEDMRPDFTPAIFVCLGEIQYDFAPTIDQQARILMSRDGERHYERTGKCSATIVHVCDRSGSACALADNTEHFMSSLQDQIAEEYCFEHFVVTGRSPLRKKDLPQTAGKDKMVSTVTVGMDFADAWVVKSESPMLKVVSVIDRGTPELLDVSGSMVEKPVEQLEIEFGDMSTETNTPNDT